MKVLELQEISKRYPGGVQAVDQFSLALNEGEVGVLVGPSGCGKTTTLRMIAGLEKPDGGVIKIQGIDVKTQRPAQRDIAVMFQSSALFPWLSVAENLAFGLAGKKLSRTQRRAQIERLAVQLKIEELLDRKARTLSGGQQQRVALGRAFLKEAAVLLMDEPLSSLDRQLRLQLQDEILTLCRQRRQTALMVTHDQSEALNLADRLVVMNNGRIEQNDRPQRIVDHPASLFAAQFLGERPMNVWKAKAEGTQAVFHSWRLRLPGPTGSGSVMIGIRPEHWQIAECAETPSSLPEELRIRVQIEQFHWVGSLRCGRGRFAEEAVEFQLPAHHPAKLGDQLTLAVSEADIHFFDAETGFRLATPISIHH